MAWEFSYKTDTLQEHQRVPRRFETFDEAWDIARKLIEAVEMDKHKQFELSFYQVE